MNNTNTAGGYNMPIAINQSTGQQVNMSACNTCGALYETSKHCHWCKVREDRARGEKVDIAKRLLGGVALTPEQAQKVILGMIK